MPESLGKILKKARESKHLSLEEISERSRIPKHIVSIIEEDRLSEIKSSFYAKSFVKTYAGFLGALDESGVKEYLAKGGVGQQQVLQKKPETISKPVVRKNEVLQIDFSIINKYKTQILVIIAGIIILWVASFVIGQTGKFIKSIPKKKQIKAAVVKKEAPKKIEKDKPKDVIAAKVVKKEVSNEQSDFVELEVFASDNTWLQVKGDGEIMFTGLFKKGSKDIWRAKKEIKLEVGNSGVIKINIDGKPANFSGKK